MTLSTTKKVLFNDEMVAVGIYRQYPNAEVLIIRQFTFPIKNLEEKMP